jgi:hypothetical protein
MSDKITTKLKREGHFDLHLLQTLHCQPPVPHVVQPFGLAFLAAYIGKEEYQVNILNGRRS